MESPKQSNANTRELLGKNVINRTRIYANYRKCKNPHKNIKASFLYL